MVCIEELGLFAFFFKKTKVEEETDAHGVIVEQCITITTRDGVIITMLLRHKMDSED